MKYKVVRVYDSLEEFETEVKALMDCGWKLVGGVSVCEDRENRYTFVQALTQKEQFE